MDATGNGVKPERGRTSAGRRVPEIEGDALNPRQRAIHDAILASRGSIAGPFRVWLHSPEFADRAQALGKVVRYETGLEPRISELAILATARAWDCQNEWSIHEPMALRAGLDRQTLDRIRTRERTVSQAADEQAVHCYVSELLGKRFVSEGTFRAAVDHLGRQGVVELTGLVGYYTLVALTMNAFEIPVPEGIAATLTDCPTFG